MNNIDNFMENIIIENNMTKFKIGKHRHEKKNNKAMSVLSLTAGTRQQMKPHVSVTPETSLYYPDFAGSVKYKTSRAFTLPTCSGVYFIHDFRGIHYIGEAKNLQQRFLQHHTNEDNVILIELVRYPFGELCFYWLTTKTKPKAVKLQKYWIRVFQPIANKVKYKKDRS